MFHLKEDALMELVHTLSFLWTSELRELQAEQSRSGQASAAKHNAAVEYHEAFNPYAA